MGQQGYIKVSGNFNLAANHDWKNTSIQELHLSCDTTAAAVNITLPKIEDTGRFLNLKIFVHDVSENAGTNNITVTCNAADEISNGPNAKITQDGGSMLITISDINEWFVINSSSSTALAEQGSVLYVDALYGSDATAAPGSIQNKYKTIKAAVADYTNGALIKVLPGTYAENNINDLAEVEGLTVRMHFENGATVSSTDSMFSDGNITSASVFVTGEGTFSAVFLSNFSKASSSLWIKGQRMSWSNSGFVHVGNNGVIVAEADQFTTAGVGAIAYIENATDVVMDITCKRQSQVGGGFTIFGAGSTGSEINAYGNWIVNGGNAFSSAMSAGSGTINVYGDIEFNNAANTGQGAIFAYGGECNLFGELNMVAGTKAILVQSDANATVYVEGRIYGTGQADNRIGDCTLNNGIWNSTDGQQTISHTGGRTRVRGWVRNLSNAAGSDGIRAAAAGLTLDNARIECTNAGVLSVNTGGAAVTVQTMTSYANRNADAAMVPAVGALTVDATLAY